MITIIINDNNNDNDNNYNNNNNNNNSNNNDNMVGLARISRINDWNSGTDLQHVSLKAVFVFLAVALQKPGRKSKAKDHQVILSKRLEKWKRGEIEG